MHLPVFVRADRLMQGGNVGGIIDPQQHDRQVARNPQCPERRLRGSTRNDLRGRGAQPRIVAGEHAAKGLEISGVRVADAKVAQLHLRLCPSQGGGAREGRGVAVPVDEVEQRIRCIGNHRPEGHAGDAARRDADPAPDGKDRVQYGSGCPRQGLVDHRSRSNIAPAPDEFCTVRLDLDRRGILAFDHRDMCRPDLAVGGRAAAAGGDDHAKFGQIIRDDEHLGKGWVRLVSRRGGQHQFGVRRHVDLPCAAPDVGQRDTPGLCIIFSRDDDFGQRRQPRGLVRERGLVLAEDGAVQIRTGACRLDTCGPKLARGRVAQEKE